MGNFVKFNDWEKTKYSSVEEDSTNSPETQSEEVAELLAQISELTSERKTHIKNKNDFEAQIIEIDIKILKCQVEQCELKEKRKQLVGAKDISDKRRREGKHHD